MSNNAERIKTQPMAPVGQIINTTMRDASLPPSSDRIEQTKRVVFALLRTAEAKAERFW